MENSILQSIECDTFQLTRKRAVAVKVFAVNDVVLS